MNDLVLPAFELDCRDWLVVTPADVGLPDELAGSPLIVVLSTVVLDGGSFVPASGIVTVGLLDEGMPPSRPVRCGAVAREMVDGADSGAPLRYVLPAPDGQLALLAEFSLSEGSTPAVVDRVTSLMASFRWA